jgi:hypothetical protein
MAVLRPSFRLILNQFRWLSVLDIGSVTLVNFAGFLTPTGPVKGRIGTNPPNSRQRKLCDVNLRRVNLIFSAKAAFWRRKTDPRACVSRAPVNWHLEVGQV